MSEKEKMVDVGRIPLKTIEDWGDMSPRFKALISEKQRFQQAFKKAQDSLKDIGVPMSYIEKVPCELFEELGKRLILVSYARESVEGFFNHKTVEEIEKETVSNENWINEVLEQIIELHIESVIHATVFSGGPAGIAIVIGGFRGNEEEAKDTSQ